MLLKILFTLLIIIGAIFYVRIRARNRTLAPMAPPLPRPVAPERPRLAYYLALGLLLIMLTGAGYYLFQIWFDGSRIVTVRVINSNTGSVTSYEVYKGDVVAGESSFHTVDGRTITMAAVERMEMGGK
ncbi:MAG: hypothetical protein GY814_12775 [Gammaproteobacteria bacterium]|nr:hypothetical protein [Gammaproteobacteria bacterium]